MKRIVVDNATSAEKLPGVTPQFLYDRSEGVVIHMTLKPEALLKTHTTLVDVVFYVLSGEVEVSIGEETETFTADTLIESPKGIPHGLKNPSGASEARLLVIKLPKP